MWSAFTQMLNGTTIRKELVELQQAFLVLFVGCLKRGKRVIELVDAFVRLRQKRADALLLRLVPRRGDAKRF